jgi:predicted metal-binding membrane protein
MKVSLEAALARHRAICLAAVVLLILLAWAWLLAGAGMGMERGISNGMPGMAMPAPPQWDAILFLMWWTMMVAMMLPSAAPMILLYARAAQHGTGTRPATGTFLAGYLVAWGLFSLAASGLQFLLERASLIDPMAMAFQSRHLSGAILLLAGVYQLTPLKDACLRQCRNPAQFLSTHYRPGVAGALRMGLLHGTYCIGCCWLLMLLLFVGGVMNLVWIVLLTIAVACEKLQSMGRLTAVAIGVACLGGGSILLVT